MPPIGLADIDRLTDGRLGTFDVPCPLCGPFKRAVRNQRRPVLRVYRIEPGFAGFHCARCGEKGAAVDRSGPPPDPIKVVKARARAADRDRALKAERLRKAQWLWSLRMPIAGSIAEVYLRRARSYGGPLPATLGFLPAGGDCPPAMIGAFRLAHEIGPGEISIADAAVRGVPRREQGRVVNDLSAEDGTADTVVPRLVAAGADLKRVQFVTAVRNQHGNGCRAFSLQSDLELLDREIRRLGDVRLVGVDPISSYLGPRIDNHANAAVRSVLEPLGEMAERLRVAVVAITHPPKGTGTTAINRFIGSIAFVAAARAAYMVTRDPGEDTRRLFLPVKNNLAPLGKGLAFRLKERSVGGPDRVTVASSIVWEGSYLDISANQALLAADSNRDNREKPARAEAEEFLKCVLGNGAVPSNEIRNEARAAGVSWPTVRRAKDRLAIKARKTGMDGGWVWALPKTLNSSEDAHPPKLNTFEPDEHLRANANGKPTPANDSWPDLPPCLDRRIPRPR